MRRLWAWAADFNMTASWNLIRSQEAVVTSEIKRDQESLQFTLMRWQATVGFYTKTSPGKAVRVREASVF